MLQTKKIWTLLTVGGVLLGLMASPVLATEVIVAVEEVFEKTVDNVIVLYDSSESMSEKIWQHRPNATSGRAYDSLGSEQYPARP